MTLGFRRGPSIQLPRSRPSTSIATPTTLQKLLVEKYRRTDLMTYFVLRTTVVVYDAKLVPTCDTTSNKFRFTCLARSAALHAITMDALGPSSAVGTARDWQTWCRKRERVSVTCLAPHAIGTCTTMSSHRTC